jgi:hypothetical protein
MASLVVRPGSRVRLKGQDSHIPDFYVVRSDRDRCWIRQHDWGPETQLNVSFAQLFVPEDTPQRESYPQEVRASGATAPVMQSAPVRAVTYDNVIYMEAYRRKKAR